MNREKVEKALFPVTCLLTISDTIFLFLTVYNYITDQSHFGVIFNLLLIGVMLLIVFSCVLFYYYWNNKKTLSLFESLGNERASLFMVIKMILNKDHLTNEAQIDHAVLEVEVVNAKPNSDVYRENYDMKFTWTLNGKNTTGKDLDKLYFRLAGDNTTNLNTINFKAIQILEEHKYSHTNHEMNYDKHASILKENFYILPLEFYKKLLPNEKFTLTVSYTWPKCYNALLDHLILAPFNFSKKPLDSFEVHVKIDDNIITKDAYVRLYRMIAQSTKLRTFEGIQTLDVVEKPFPHFTTPAVICEDKYLYFVEIRRNHDE